MFRTCPCLFDYMFFLCWILSTVDRKWREGTIDGASKRKAYRVWLEGRNESPLQVLVNANCKFVCLVITGLVS